MNVAAHQHVCAEIPAPEPEAASRLSVLVVDDSRMQCQLLAAALTKWGYDVVTALSGRAALRECESRTFSIIISDWVMPGMNGPEFCAQFRAIAAEAYTYFVLLTSKNGAEEIAGGLNSGADDFLTKPVGMSELRARLQAGERIVRMQAQLADKNRKLNKAFDEIQSLYHEVQKDLDQARHLQQSLVRDTDIRLDRARVSMLLQPSGHVGGDLVGSFSINPDTLAVYALDVSGHGVSSALLAARLAGSLSATAPHQNIAMKRVGRDRYAPVAPEKIARRLNEMLLQEFETELYVTLAYAICDLPTGRVTCLQAGHPHPIRLSDGVPEALGAGGLPIGLIPDPEFESFSFDLGPGDRLFLHSDGITEAENPMGEMLDDSGLHRILSRHCATRGPELLDDLIWEVTEFSQSKEFSDDISVVVLDYFGPDGGDQRNPK